MWGSNAGVIYQGLITLWCFNLQNLLQLQEVKDTYADLTCTTCVRKSKNIVKWPAVAFPHGV